jgi:hypothetical protein
MVAVKTEVMTPGQRAKARLQRVRDMRRVEGVRVLPNAGEGYSEDQMRRLLKHPTAGGFRSDGDIEWPNDTFTKRRLSEGSIRLVEQKSEGERRDRSRQTQREE